jgi:glycosyltransferase involved in cell wall biosynthesis
MKEQLVKLGANPALVEIIYFGIDVNYFSPLKKSEEFRQKFINGSRNIIVTSNRQLAEVYRIDLLLTAVSELDLELQDQLVLLIASAGPQRDSLLQYAYDLKIGEFTRFLGRLSDEDMSTLVASSDLYVSTSPTDGGIASSVAEAMACEVPVITSDFGDNRHWVTESGAGLTFKVNSHSELKSNLEKLIPSRDLRISMGQLGREKIKIDNNSDVETEKLERFFQETLKIN